MPSYATPSTNLSTGLSTKPTRLTPDYLAKTQNYVPLSVFFAGVPEQEADPDSLFGLRMPDRKKKVPAQPKEKKSKGGSTSGAKGDKDKDDDSGEGKKEKGTQGGAQGPERSQTSKPRPQASVPAQGAQQPSQAVAAGGKQEALTGALGRLLDVVQGKSVAPLDEGKLLQPQKCKYCDEPATKAVIHSNAYAYVPVCDKHVNKAKKAVGSEYCYTSTIPQKGEKCELCDKPASYVVSALTFDSNRRTTGRTTRVCCQGHLKRVRGEVNNASNTSRHAEPTVKRLKTEMTTTANVPTLPVPIGAGDGRKFLDHPDDDKRKKKKKGRRLSRRLYILLRQ